MTVKVEIKDKEDPTKTFFMLFGNSYKGWEDQFIEFMYRYFNPKHEAWSYKNVANKVVNAWKSSSPWKGWGGLKWCEEKDFQEELNREGCQSNDPDNPSPRLYKDFVFEYMDTTKIERTLKEGY